MTIKNLWIPALCLLLFGCKNEPRKIIVYSNKGAVIDKEAKTITEKDKSGHLENSLDYSDNVTLELNGPGGNKSLQFPDPGYYIVNAKAADTIIGGYQKFSTAGEAKRSYTTEDIQRSVDSLKNLVAGNISGSSSTFFILPYSSAKITANTNAVIVGPYHKISSIAAEDGKEPEVYRFYSIKEVRETLENLEKIGQPEVSSQ